MPGRNGTKKKVSKKPKARQQRKMSSNSPEPEPEYSYEGRRIVDLAFLGEKLFCKSCKKVLSLKNIKNEDFEGMQSILHIVCTECNFLNQVKTGRTHETALGTTHSDVTTTAVLGTLHSGIDFIQFSKFLLCMSVPGMDKETFDKYKREVADGMQKVAQKSGGDLGVCPLGAMERIIRHNQATNPVVHENKVPEKTEKSQNEAFKEKDDEKTEKELVGIVVSYDMVWSRISKGESCETLSGVVIGYKTKKAIAFGTRKRYCKICSNEKSPAPHDCSKHLTGCPKQLEAELQTELLFNSPMLRKAGLKVVAVVDDPEYAFLSRKIDVKSWARSF